MVKFSYVTSKRRVDLSGPVHWGEVTTRMFRDVAEQWDGRDLIQLFCIMFGADYNVVFNSTSEEVAMATAAGTRFIMEGSVNLHELPVPKEFMGKLVPRNIGTLSIGQAMYLKNQAQGKKKDAIVALAISVYMQPVLDGGEPNTDKMKELEEKILPMPIMQTLPLAFFFLNRTRFNGSWLRSAWLLLKVTGIRNTINYLSSLVRSPLMNTPTWK